MFSILIVEDDICACKELTDYFSKIDDTCIIGCTATISEAVSLCQLHKCCLSSGIKAAKPELLMRGPTS